VRRDGVGEGVAREHLLRGNVEDDELGRDRVDWRV
jgi:hypothetical protein